MRACVCVWLCSLKRKGILLTSRTSDSHDGLEADLAREVAAQSAFEALHLRRVVGMQSREVVQAAARKLRDARWKQSKRTFVL